MEQTEKRQLLHGGDHFFCSIISSFDFLWRVSVVLLGSAVAAIACDTISFLLDRC